MSADHKVERWEYSRIGDTCFTTSGGTPSRKKPEYYNGSIPWLKSGELRDGKIYSAEETITEEGLTNSSAKVIKSGSLLIALYGATVGRLGLLEIDAATNQAICSIETPNDIKREFLFWYLRQKREALLQSRIGGAQPNISQSILKKLEIPIPLLDEQHRIVAKIEELFTKLDAGVAALSQIQAQLRQYRQSVLKSAVEGRLTAQWREEHKGDLEPASELLKRILREHREKWEAEQLAKYEAKGQKLPKNWREKYKKPAALDTSSLPELPEGWVWAKNESVCEKIQDGTHFSPKIQYNEFATGRYMYITAKNIREYGLDLNDISYIDGRVHREIYARCDVKKNDVLIVKDGVKTGTVAMNDLDEQFTLLSSVAFLRPIRSVLLPKYLHLYLKSPIGFRSVTGKMSGTAIKRIILRRLNETPIAVLPLVEQEVIVARVGELLSICDGVEQDLNSHILSTNTLYKSILNTAFKGDLVPQDPEDEPAEKPLGRITADREKSLKMKRKQVLPVTGSQPRASSKTIEENIQLSDSMGMIVSSGDEQDDIVKLLQKNNGGPMRAKDVFAFGRYKDDIAIFYRALREEVKKGTVREVRKDNVSYLKLAKK